MTQKHQIQLFEEKKVRTVWDEELQEWFFSVVDIVQVLTDSADVKQYIKKMRKRDLELEAKWGTICTPVRMLAPDGKQRITLAATTEGIFRLIQSIPSPKAEPFKQWMAEVAAQRIDQMQDPELNFEQAKGDKGQVPLSPTAVIQVVVTSVFESVLCQFLLVFVVVLLWHHLSGVP